MKRRSAEKGRRRRRPRRPRVRAAGATQVIGWLEEAQAVLAEGDTGRAFAIARKLHARRLVSGFEVEALAHLQAGARDEAIRVLERGIGLAGDVWSLWQLFGNALSDAGRYEEAQAAYRRALRCPQVDVDSVELNLAVLLERIGRWEDALALAEARDAALLGGRFATVRASCLTQLGRPAEARDVLCAVLEEDDRSEALEPARRAALLGHFAELSLTLGEREAAREAALQALGFERGHEHALWCMRELDGAVEPGARVYRLLLCGEWRQPLEPGGPLPGFYTTVTVVARDLDAALARALALEPADLRASIALEENEEHEASAELPSGVYHASRYAVFPHDG